MHTRFFVIPFEMARQPRLIVEDGGFRRLAEILEGYGFRRIILLTGGKSLRKSDSWEMIRRDLTDHGISSRDLSVSEEPSPEMVDEFVEELCGDSADFEAVVAIGGGSVIDAGKTVAAAYTMDGSIANYLEGVGDRSPTGTTLPIIAIPTTAGTGSEATKNAVLRRTGLRGFKKSLRHENYIPVAVILDATLQTACPEEVTRASGLDAITQLLEAFVSNTASEATRMVSGAGLPIAFDAFPKVLTDGYDVDARRSMAYASYLGGVALANAGLGVVHGIASPLGGIRPIPHGVVCGLLVAEATRRELEKGTYRTRYDEAARTFGKSAEEMVSLLDEWAKPLPRLSSFGFTNEELVNVAEQSGNKYQPTTFSTDEILSMMNAVL